MLCSTKYCRYIFLQGHVQVSMRTLRNTRHTRILFRCWHEPWRPQQDKVPCYGETPVYSYSGLGMSVVRSEADLRSAVEKALAASRAKRFIAERYMYGNVLHIQGRLLQCVMYIRPLHFWWTAWIIPSMFRQHLPFKAHRPIFWAYAQQCSEI